MESVIWGIIIYAVIRSAISYYNYRRFLNLYRNVLDFLNRYPYNSIGWYLSMASALIKCQKYEDAYKFLTESKAKFPDFIKERPDVAKEIDVNIEFCKHPISKSSQLYNRDTNWGHYVMVYNFGNIHANNLSKQTMAKVFSWIHAGKP